MSDDSKEDKTKDKIFKEIQELSKRADETSVNQSDLFNQLGDEDIDTGFDASIFKDTADPDRSYKLYYGMQRLLMDNLPKGKSNKKFRQFVYDEKNLFLNRGAHINEITGIRGSDARMTYITNFLEVAFNTVADWIKTGESSFDLFQRFWDLNEAKGYHKRTEISTSKEEFNSSKAD